MGWMDRAGKAAIPVALGLAGLVAVVAAAQPTRNDAGPRRVDKTAKMAVAILQGAPDHPKVSGTVRFLEEGDHLWVVARITGVDKPGSYGLHLHENGQCTPDPAGSKHFSRAGGHFNPTGAPHACLGAARHHAGDLGNVVFMSDGLGRIEVATEMLALSGPNSVIGKAIILDAGPDDCTTQPSGNAGARLACGVVKSNDSASAQPRH